MAAAEPGNALEAGLRIAAALEARAVSYALGGALAYALWAVPRDTVDVDVNVFAGPDALDPALEALRTAGVAFEDDRARKESDRDGMFVAWFGPIRVDVFTPSIDFSWEAERTRVRHRIGAREAWFLSAEALGVFKMLFFRTKDLADMERLVAVQGPGLDRAYVRRWLVEMMGEEDERVARWDALVEEHGAG